jgi:Uma2 family endonuclease
MSAVLAETRRGVPFTRADLEAMPDDGRRYELLDGCLVVTPAPTMPHQRAVTRLWRLLDAACPPDLEVFVAPFDVVLGDATTLQPDVLVARRHDLTHANLPAAPVLAVEVLSPSTRLVDLRLKPARYEEAGTLAYWVFDPEAVRLRAWDLRDGAYVEVADVSGEEPYEAAVPFAVTVVPAALVG